MSEVESSVNSNPLIETHRQAEAEFQSYAGIDIVSTFGEPQAEYAAIRKSAALIDLSQRGILEVTGADRLSFLNNLLTNQTFDKNTKTGMAAGSKVYAFLLNAKSGRISADMNVLELGDRTLLEMDARLVLAVLSALEKYVFSEKVKFANTIGSLHEIAIHGPMAAELLKQECSIVPVDVQQIEMFGVPAIVWRDNPAGVPGYHIIVRTDAARTVWMNLLAKYGSSSEAGKRALRPIGWAVFNAVRIEAGATTVWD